MVAVRIPSRQSPITTGCHNSNMRNRPSRLRLRQRLTALATHEARRLLLPLVALTAVSSAGTLAAPGLLHHDQSLLLVALSPRLSFLAIAAPQTHLVPFLIVAGIRLCLADPFHFVLARRHGAAAVHRVTARNRLTRALASVATKSIPLLVFLRPNGTHLAIAGAATTTRRSTLHVAAADIGGTVVYLLLIHRLGAQVLPG